MNANIEALVKKHIAPFGLSNAGGYARLVRDALTEQAETHAIELRAYEATVANLNERIRQLEAERVPDGWQLVPIKLTTDMYDAAADECEPGKCASKVTEDRWNAMLAAVPQQKEVE